MAEQTPLMEGLEQGDSPTSRIAVTITKPDNNEGYVNNRQCYNEEEYDLSPEEIDIDELLQEGLRFRSPIASPLSPAGIDSPWYSTSSACDEEEESILGLAPVPEAPESSEEEQPDSVTTVRTRTDKVKRSRRLEGPVLYNFEDYVPDKLSIISDYKSGTRADVQTTQRAYHRTNGRQFVRARTLDSINVPRRVLDEAEIPGLVTSPQREFHRNGPRIIPEELLPGQTHGLSTSMEHLGSSPSSSRRTSPTVTPSFTGSAWVDEDDSPDTSATSADANSGNLPQFYYTTPPRIQMATTPTSEDRRLERSGSSKGISRLARRLSHRERRGTAEERRRTLRQRSVSLDCGDGRRPLGGTNNQLEEPPKEARPSSIPTSPSLPSRLRSPNTSSSNLSGRLSRRTSGSKIRKSSLDYGDGRPERRRDKRVYQDTQALFDAVEHQDLEAVRLILENGGVDLNSINQEELTPLDVAVLTNNIPLARMLLLHGARENPSFQRSNGSQDVRLVALVSEAEKRVEELSNLVTSSANANLSASQLKEYERLLSHWEFRHKLFKKMMAGYDLAKPPGQPKNVSLSVASSSSLYVKFDEPASHNGAMVTRYKVEWSCFEDFEPLAGEQIIEDVRYMYYEIPDLVQGNAYYVRVRAWNIKGFGESEMANPGYAVPSSWREVDGVKARGNGVCEILNNLFTNIKNSRPATASEIRDTSAVGATSPLHPRRSNMRKSIKNLFSSAPKFQKTLKRGVYLSCLLYNEDRILVTNEDNLPIMEVDENFSSASLHSDFHWLMKVACNWEDVKSLRKDMDKSSTCSSEFRSKLLQAAALMQSALGVQDLGQFYYKPTKDANGSIVLTTINYIPEAKSVNTTHVKWVPISKAQRKAAANTDSTSAAEILLNSLKEMLLYHQTSSVSLPRGLYLGYLKLKSSVDLIRVLVPKRMPNVLPHTRVRESPHVSKEEWEWLQSLGMSDNATKPSDEQNTLQKDLVKASKKLLDSLGISDDEAVSHRLYDVEVIELSEDVSFILLVPPVESVCLVPGHTEEITEKPNFISLPVQVFEMIHMSTYQYDFITRCARISAILEMDLQLAQQAHREAFSTEEIGVAKERLEQLQQFQKEFDDAWRDMRWTLDIITYARDKNVRGGIPLGILYAPPPSPSDSPQMDRKDIDSNSGVSTNSDMGYHSDRSSGDHNFHSNLCDTAADSQCATAQQDDTEKPEHSNPAEKSDSDVWTRRAMQPGILRVFAAYDTGLSKGTSVKLHVTPRTTSREVVNLVVTHLNKAVLMKGLRGPFYSEEQLEDFCLVAVIGARERVLRDDYQPLQLQNPWTKGRLFVRLRTNLLAAIEQGHVTTV